MNIPNPLTGTSDLVPWLNKLRAAIIESAPAQGVGYKVRGSPQGFVLEIADGGKGAGAVTVLKYNSAKASTKGKFYKVRPDDEAVLVGITIGVAPNAIIKYATPGKYLCLKSVAAHSPTTLSGEIPQLPDPVSTDPEFTGTPSKHWEWFSPGHACVDGETHVV